MKSFKNIIGFSICCLLTVSEPIFTQTLPSPEDTIKTAFIEAETDSIKGLNKIQEDSLSSLNDAELDTTVEAATTMAPEVSQLQRSKTKEIASEVPSPVSSWAWLTLTAAVFLVAGYLLGWLIYGRKKEGKETNSAAAVLPPSKNAVRQGKISIKDASEDNKPASPLPGKPASNPMDSFLSGWRSQTERLKDVEAIISSETEVKNILKRIIYGRGTGSFGLYSLIEPWEANQRAGILSEQHLLKDFARREMQKNFAWLYRLSAVTDIVPLREHFEKLGVPVEELKDIRNNLFSLMDKYSGLRFALPQFGSSFSDKTFDLIPDNINALGGLDQGALLTPMKTWTAEAKRPIIDVGVLGLIASREEMSDELRQKFPTRTSVAYYVNH